MDMIQKYKLTDAKTVSTTVDLNVKLRKDDSVSKQVNSVTYQSMDASFLLSELIGSPDIRKIFLVVKCLSSRSHAKTS